MDSRTIDITGSVRIPLADIVFRSSRSGGPGGQNVNKVETRVELVFDVCRAACLDESVRHTLLNKLSARLTSEGLLIVAAQESRSQWTNKHRALEKFVGILQAALKKQKKRLPTHPTGASRRDRLDRKRRRGDLKKSRSRAVEE